MISASVPAGKAGYRAVFGVAEFRALFTFQFLRAGTDSLAVLALSVLVYERSASAFAAAVVFVSGMLPQVVGGALLTSLADRHRPRPLLVAVSTVRLAIALLLASGGMPTAAVIALLILGGSIAPVQSAASQGLLRDVLPGGAGYVLGRSLFTMTMAGAMVASQAGGGLMLLWIGPHGVLWCAAALSLAGVSVCLLGIGDHPPRSEATADASQPFAAATWRANRRLLADRRIRGLLLAHWVPFSLAVGAEGVIVPYAAEAGRAALSGFLYAAVAAGLFTGNLVVGRFVSPARQESLALPLCLFLGGAFMLPALVPAPVTVLVILALGSLGFAYELGLQRRFASAIPDELSGRAFGLLATGIMTGQALAMAAAGALAEVLAPSTVMAVSGGAAAISALALARHMRPAAITRPDDACR